MGVLGADPVPHAMVITGIVVAFAATALGVALIVRLGDETSGTGRPADQPAQSAPDRGDPC